MRKILCFIFLLLSPAITFILVTTLGKDFTNARGSSTEVLFQYVESYLLQVEGLGIDLASVHEKLDDRFGWCTKYKLVIKKAPAPQAAVAAKPVASTTSAPAVTTSTGGVVAVAPAQPAPPTPQTIPENIRNILYGAQTELTPGFEVFCKSPEGDSLFISTPPNTASNIEIQRFLHKNLIIPNDSSKFDIGAQGKFSFVLSTKIGDILVQSTSPATLSVYTEQLKLHLLAKSGKILLTLYRPSTDQRTITPIKILSANGTSIKWADYPELKDGAFSDVLPSGPVAVK